MLPVQGIAFLLASQAVLPPPHSKPAPPAQALAARSLVDAELAFAHRAATENTQSAFLSVLDEASVLFRPGPVDGKAWCAAEKVDDSKLTWFPSYVEVSQAGDLGFSTGPYQWREKAGSTPVYHGHFVSMWGRRGGVWKLLLDTGSPHPAPPTEDPLFEPERATSTQSAESAPAFGATALQNVEREFADAASMKGAPQAYALYLAPKARIYRPGALPTTGLEGMQKALEARKGRLTWAPVNGAVASSNDLGYTYGFAEFRPEVNQGQSADKAESAEPALEKYTFLHVWKRQLSGRWQVVLDLRNPMPKGK